MIEPREPEVDVESPELKESWVECADRGSEFCIVSDAFETEYNESYIEEDGSILVKEDGKVMIVRGQHTPA